MPNLSDKYIHKTDGTVIRAIQFSQENFINDHKLLRLLQQSRQFEINRYDFGMLENQFSLHLSAKTGELKQVKDNDWILLDNFGVFHVIDSSTFNETYQKAAEGWLVRVKVEQVELNRKLEALSPVVSQTVKPAAMSEKQWELLNRQWFHMTQYNQILIERIAEAEQQ
ncbi:hypothetical protein KTN00_12125 [Acinetobacter soli]|uniref:crAss001_48 related protein n=1 Tax=Acinetobacter soli TaxID=487316 RepID=UPI001C444E8B|nr:hypothetical protein [Acinetobacter soli]MBV6551762.1 hypothetical protein [Acinetobacter soli]